MHITGDGWVNDPHAVIHHGGRFHVFYQCVPGSSEWAPACSWGHASSPDWSDWTIHPPALQPGDGDTGCWTGGIAVGPDGPVLFYSAVAGDDLNRASIRVARPRADDLIGWDKGEVVVCAPAGVKVFRDPMILGDAATGYRMLVGGGSPEGGPLVFSYRSTDLLEWTPDGTLIAADPHDGLGEAWECPQLLAVDGRQVFIVSAMGGSTHGDVLAGVGDLVGGTLEIDTWTRLCANPGPYAPTSFLDPDGQPCLVFWLRGVKGPGWHGAISLPYRVGVRAGAAVLELAPWARDRAGEVGVEVLTSGPGSIVWDASIVEVCGGGAFGALSVG